MWSPPLRPADAVIDKTHYSETDFYTLYSIYEALSRREEFITMNSRKQQYEEKVCGFCMRI